MKWPKYFGLIYIDLKSRFLNKSLNQFLNEFVTGLKIDLQNASKPLIPNFSDHFRN